MGNDRGQVTRGVTSILLLGSVANASITAELVDRGQQFIGTRSYDVVVNVTGTPGVGADDWTACGMTATLTGCRSFVDNTPWNPPWEPFVPFYFWGSFFTSPEYIPNAIGFGIVQFAYPDEVIEGPQLRFGEWFDTADTGNGEYVRHRLTVLCDDACGEECRLHVDFETAAQNIGGTLFPFEWSVTVGIPEPGSLALLALGGPALIRRR